jgi:outer membrane receptor protein involved in Fe transport
MFSKNFLGGAALAALSLAPAVAIAQQTTSSIRGEVITATGAPISGATVVITHVPTGRTSQVTTSAGGLFSASGLRVGGPYTVAVSAPNYQGEQVDVPSLGLSEAQLDINLQAESTGESIVVTAARVRTSGTGPATGFSADDIAGIASVTRDIRDIMRRDPLVTLDPTNSGAPQIAGQNNRFNSFSIDGVNFRDEFGLNATGLPSQRSPISVDALQALTVETTPYKAENGNFLGGAVNAVTKSGTNEFHGTAAYNWQDSFSVPARVDSRPTGLQKTWDQEAYGYTLGGPVIKDRLFFFGAYEYFKTPKTGTQGPADSGAGTPAPGVSTAEMQQVQSILKNVYGYDAGVPFTSGNENDRKILAKIDWNITDKHRLAVTYNDILSGIPFDGSTQGGRTFDAANATQRLQLNSHWYNRRESVKTSVGQINSDWTDNFSTEVRISQKEYEVAQTALGAANSASFEICSTPTSATAFSAASTCASTEGQILLGPDSSRQANQLNTRTDAYKIKGDYRIGDHKIEGGYELSRVKVFNLFQQGAVGEYYFNSIADLQNRTASRAFFAGGAADGDGNGTIDVYDTAANYQYKSNTAFIEDTWDVTDKLRLGLGLRYDFLQSDDVPPLNPNFVTRSATFYEAQFRNIDNTTAIDGLSLLQPRFSFMYDLTDDIQLRGGVGRFGSTGPAVWIANSFQSNGVTSSTINVTGASSAAQRPLLSNVSIIGTPALATSQLRGAGLSTATVNLVDPNFEIPSMWRASIGAAADFHVLGENPLHATIDFLYSQNENAPYMKNLRLTRAAGAAGMYADGRPIYGGSGTDLLLTEADEGEGKIVTTTLSQEYNNGIGWTFGYAHQDVTELSPMTSSTASSNYQNIAIFDANNPDTARSNYEITDRFTLTVDWKKEFFKGLETRFSLFGEHRSGFPFSYTMNGANAPGFSAARSLLYVPNFAGDSNPNDLVVDMVTFNSAATLNAFRDFVLGGDLAGYQGQVTKRNDFTSPDISRVDLHFSQDLPWLLNNRGHKLTFIADIINLGNLINDEWGTIEKYAFPGTQPLVTAANGVVQPNGSLGYTYSGFATPTTVRCPDSSVCPREGLYTIQLGMKYAF